MNTASPCSCWKAFSFAARTLLACLLLAAPAGATPQFTSLYSFSALSSTANQDGANPQSSLVQGSDGNFYGTTALGGSAGSGTIVKITPSGALTTLYTFSPLTGGFNGDGETPQAGLILGSDGDFYGTTVYGGSANSGTVFKITPSGTLTTLANFTGGDGAYPYAALVQGSDGNFYGTTFQGGASGTGTVFQVTPAGALSTLYSFTALTGGTNGDGAAPLAGLVQGGDGNFYGTTAHGGTAGDGTVFQVTPSGTLTALVSFTGANGADPQASLALGRDGNFYGTTRIGGSADAGTVFQMTPAGVLTTLYSFTAPDGSGTNGDGADPEAGLILGSDGDFYGTANQGGSSGIGTVFKTTPSGTETTLADFTGPDGVYPAAGLALGGDGNFYGTTQLGGTNNTGTIFKITVQSQVVYDFSALSTSSPYTNSDGANVEAALTLGRDGDFYGTTEFGGSSGNGTAFKISPAGTVTTLVDFDGTNGGNPQAGLIQGRDGNFYGTTGGVIANGGSAGFGTVFTMTPSGALTTLVNFNGTNGAQPLAALMQGGDGDFYGTTSGGGSAGLGTVFMMTPSGTLTTLVSFTGSSGIAPGQNPVASLILGSDGNFYGTTYGSASQFGDSPPNDGTVFKMTPAGALTTLVTFTGANGLHPAAALVQGSDGNFYGTTVAGGSAYVPGSQAGGGTVFKITPGGALTTLVSFTGENGTFPNAALVQGSDGDFYGTTEAGGATLVLDPLHLGDGVAFKMTPSGVLTTLIDFNNAIGYAPFAGLLPGGDGSFYGAAFQGGLGETGTIYRLTGPTQGFGSAQITPENTPVTFTLAFDDPAGLGVDGVAFPVQPAHGTLSLVPGSIAETGTAGTATVTYTPAPGYIGVDLLTYTVTGYTGTSAPQAVTVSVGPVPTWTAFACGAAPDGTGRVLWDRSDGAAGVWVVGIDDTQTIVGPTYGPYPGWTAKALAVAGDGTSRVLWTNANGIAGVWSFNASGTETLMGSTYGPFPGWTAQAIGVALDGTSRVLWTNANGMAGVWSFDASDVATVSGATYGPFSGWAAKSLATVPDGTSRVLWTNANGMAGVWSFSAADAATVIGPTYGPYPGWTAQSIGAAGDGTARALWTNTDGEAGVWSFNASDTATTIGGTYGPFTGWSAISLGTSSDGTSRVLWDNVSRTAGVWSFGASDAASLAGPTYGPY